MKFQAFPVLAVMVLFCAPTAVPRTSHDQQAERHAACRHNALNHDHDHDHVVMSAAVQAEFGLTLAVAAEAQIRQTITMPAEVRLDADRLAHIMPRYDGLVTEVRAQLGDRVERGRTLAVIESDATLSPYSLQTLLDGTVISKHIALGEAVGRKEPVYVAADLNPDYS